MSDFTYQIRDGHDRLEDFATAAERSTKPSIINAADFAAKLRQHHWDNRRITSHGSYYGGEEYQWLAHIPGELVEILDNCHPGWDQDEKLLRKVLQLYPGAKVLPEEIK